MSVTPEQLADRAAIQDAVARYCRGIDRLDADCMKSAYWPDATDEHGGGAVDAWTFVDHAIASHNRWRATLHCIFNHIIVFDGDGVNASGEVYNVSFLFRAEEPVQDTWFGRYLDRYQKRQGEWRILQRVCVHEATRTDRIAQAMSIGWDAYRSGSFDRPSGGRPVGP